VLVLGELALGLGAYSKGRRIGTQAVRKIPLELLELAKEAVVLGVRNRRTVEDVVLVGGAVEQNAQLRGAAMRLPAALAWRLLIVALSWGWLLLLFFLP
jgi:hypothetical protein